MTQILPKGPEDNTSSYMYLLSTAQKSNETYKQVNNCICIVPWECDSNIQGTEGEGVNHCIEKR
eukprot:13225177-Ditylum_brightwellii.AAC.1